MLQAKDESDSIPANWEDRCNLAADSGDFATNFGPIHGLATGPDTPGDCWTNRHAMPGSHYQRKCCFAVLAVPFLSECPHHRRSGHFDLRLTVSEEVSWGLDHCQCDEDSERGAVFSAEALASFSVSRACCESP